MKWQALDPDGFISIIMHPLLHLFILILVAIEFLTLHKSQNLIVFFPSVT